MGTTMMLKCIAVYSLLLSAFQLFAYASPRPSNYSLSFFDSRPLHLRAYPVFPDSPPSCPICAQNYDSINSCVQAAPVLANFSMIIFNPGAFINVIKCACTDTFQSVYPQCVDCFTHTNQTEFLDTTNTSSVLDGMRKICAISSSLLGGVATADGEVTPTTCAAPPHQTCSVSGASPIESESMSLCSAFILLLTIMTVSYLGL